MAAQIEEKMDNHGLVGLILRRGIECAPGDAELYIALANHETSRGKIDSVRWRLCVLRFYHIVFFCLLTFTVPFAFAGHIFRHESY